jgi:predicted component of viral defense system (DUF524 family)
VLGRALTVPTGGREGRLRFGNFVGRAELGGRRLDVRSARLGPGGVEGMLDEVSGWFASLPFAADGPVGAAYEVRRAATPRVLYHAFALLRDAFRRLGPHDLRGSVERVLAHPHESLSLDQPRPVPVGAADRIDSEVIDAILASPELMREVDPTSRLAASPAVRRMRGMLPETVRVRPFLHSTDNPENRFVAGALDEMIDLLRRFERLARAQHSAAKAANAGEAAEIADFLRRARRHPVFDHLRPTGQVPAQSAVLRSRPGYHDLFALHGDLQARMHATRPHDAEPLLESRDAATIYEFWCFVRVVRALEVILGPPLRRDRFAADGFQAKLSWGYAVSWAGVEALYNVSFPGPRVAATETDLRSYSLRLRPDVLLRLADGRLEVFDAKLKVRGLDLALDADEDEGSAGASSDTFKPEDLHKMHAYRDALSVDSAWILYPGLGTAPERFSAPAPAGTAAPTNDAATGADATAFRGVGAIPLRPGAGDDGGLTEVLKEMIAT